MKKALWIVIALVVIGAIVYAVKQSDSAPEVSWAFQEKTPEPTTGAPVVQVTATINGTEYDAGTYNGTCIEIDKKNLPEDETAGIVCWWDGSGDEVGVFMEDSKLVVKHGEIQEGDESTLPSRGNFTTLFEI
ncbi:MAG: hypothetical protein QG633_151 [Patescibacteria group bacterium]|jgi:hypothetical protein|nr:hypothetical protein [Patescibacteria group bacterium]